MWVSVWVAGFSEVERPECLGECVDLGGRIEGESVDEFAYQTGSKSWARQDLLEEIFIGKLWWVYDLILSFNL